MLRTVVFACALLVAPSAFACDPNLIGCGNDLAEREATKRFNDYVANIPAEMAARRAERERAIDMQHMNDTLDQMNWAVTPPRY